MDEEIEAPGDSLEALFEDETDDLGDGATGGFTCCCTGGCGNWTARTG